MKIYTDGCSYTRGTAISLDNKFELAWPYLIKDYYKADLHNYSECGKSNDAIIRTTLEAILKDPLPFDKVIIQFTHLDRFESSPDKPHSPRSFCKNYGHPPDHPFVQFYSQFFDRSNETDRLLSHKLLNQMYMLQCVFIEQGITDYKFIVWLPIDSEYITYRHLDKTKIIFNAKELIKKDFKPDLVDGHWKDDAHKRISQWVIENYSTTNFSNKDDFIDHVY